MKVSRINNSSHSESKISKVIALLISRKTSLKLRISELLLRSRRVTINVQEIFDSGHSSSWAIVWLLSSGKVEFQQDGEGNSDLVCKILNWSEIRQRERSVFWINLYFLLQRLVFLQALMEPKLGKIISGRLLVRDAQLDLICFRGRIIPYVLRRT